MYSLKDLSDSHETLINLRIKNSDKQLDWEFLRVLTRQLEYRILQYIIENTWLFSFEEGNKMIEFYRRCITKKHKEKKWL